MPTSEEIIAQQELLKTHRLTLHQYLNRQAMLGIAHAPPEIAHGIQLTRKHIRNIKQILRVWGQVVEDMPDDDGRLHDTVENKVSDGERSTYLRIYLSYDREYGWPHIDFLE